MEIEKVAHWLHLNLNKGDAIFAFHFHHTESKRKKSGQTVQR